MSLYLVQHDDESSYVEAASMQFAITVWRQHQAKVTGNNPDDIDDPQTINCIHDGDVIRWEESCQKTNANAGTGATAVQHGSTTTTLQSTDAQIQGRDSTFAAPPSEPEAVRVARVIGSMKADPLGFSATYDDVVAILLAKNAIAAERDRLREMVSMVPSGYFPKFDEERAGHFADPQRKESSS